MPESALKLLLKYPLAILVVIAGVTVASAIFLARSEFSPSIVESFVDSAQELSATMELERQFSGNPDALLWLATDEGDLLFTAEKLRAIRAAAQEIGALPEVQRVISLADAPQPLDLNTGLAGAAARSVLSTQLRNGKVPQMKLAMPTVLPQSGEMSAEALQSLRQRVLTDDGPARALVSRDGNAHTMLIELKSPYDLPPSRQVGLVNEVLELASEHGLGENATYCSGLLAVQAYAYEQVGLVLYTYLPLGGVLISLTVLYVFRRLEVVGVTVCIAVISVCWGIAFGIAGYGKFSLLLAAVPLMVLVISTADVIHLISSYTAELQSGKPHAEALRKMFCEVGGACVLTSVTTFVGFASLVFVPSRTIRQFGVSAAAGVATALVISVVLMPLLLNWLDARGKPVQASVRSSRWTTWGVQACLRVSLWKPWLIVAGTTLLLTICGIGTARLRLDPDLTKRFTATHPISQSTRFFTEQFGGINSVEILLVGTPQELLNPENLSAVRAFTTDAVAQGDCSSATSVATWIVRLLSEVDFQNPDGQAESYEQATAAVEFLRGVDGSAVDSFLTPGSDRLRILLRIPETSYMDMLRVSNTIAAKARARFSSDIQIVQKGSAPLIGRAVGQIIRGHVQGFMFCFTAIFLLITFGLRSLKLGCLAVLPNLTPLLVLGGMLSLSSYSVDSDILAVATLGLGLAVDDTIHFLTRFQLEKRAGKSLDEALAASMNHTGQAIIRTTLILAIGFSPLALSGYWSINMLGTYLILVLFAAVLADLFFLPAILTLAYRRAVAA